MLLIITLEKMILRKTILKKHGAEIVHVSHSYIGDEYRDLIDSILKSRLQDGDCMSHNVIIENFCSLEPRNLFLFARNLSNKYGKQLLDYLIIK